MIVHLLRIVPRPGGVEGTVRGCMVGLELQCVPIVSDGLIVFILTGQRGGQVIVRLGQLGVELQGLPATIAPNSAGVISPSVSLFNLSQTNE